MPVHKYRQIKNPETGKYELIKVSTTQSARTNKSAYVRGEIDPFVSQVDGSYVDSRQALRRHNARNDVIDVRDWGNDSYCNLDAKKEREQKILGTHKATNEKRRRDISDTIDYLGSK